MPVDREKLRELTDRIQVGDTDEGADALQEIVELVRTEERGDARQAVRQELADMQLKAANDAALKTFEKKYPKLRDEPVLVEAAMHVLRDEIGKDLRKAGVTDDEMRSIEGDTERLAALHGKARLMRHEGVRQADKLLDDVGGVLSEKFNLKPAGTGRTGAEYLRDLRADRGFKTRDEDSTGHKNSSRAPGSGRLTAEQSDKAATYVEKLRAARGFAPRTLR